MVNYISFFGVNNPLFCRIHPFYLRNNYSTFMVLNLKNRHRGKPAHSPIRFASKTVQ